MGTPGHTTTVRSCTWGTTRRRRRRSKLNLLYPDLLAFLPVTGPPRSSLGPVPPLGSCHNGTGRLCIFNTFCGGFVGAVTNLIILWYGSNDSSGMKIQRKLFLLHHL